MAYQNVGTPRFYIDLHQYALANGLVEGYWENSITDVAIIEKVYRSGLNPVTAHIATVTASAHSLTSWIVQYKTDFFTRALGSAKGYVALLNHNLKSLNAIFFVDAYDVDPVDYGGSFTPIENINTPAPDVDGWSIRRFQYSGESHKRFYFSIKPEDESDWVGGEEYRIGGASFGITYDMPHSPDLSLTMSHEYDGIKQVTTKGGSTLLNANYISTPDWGKRKSWQLGDFPYYYNGRRTWDLSFSYISDSDIEPYSYYGNKYDGNTSEEGADNWFQNVLYYTMGGHLPFIFCPDPSIEYYNPDSNDENGNPIPPRVPEFAICRFDMNTFKRTQVAHKMYTTSIKLKETW